MFGRWSELLGCIYPRFVCDVVPVHLVGLSAHVAFPGDMCGFSGDVICSIYKMLNVKILVSKGGRIPVSMVVDDGEIR